MKTPLRILIVEDSEADTALIVHELRRHGYEPAYERVETESDMGAALDSADWDIVVADYTMPRFSGTAALGLLKERGLDVPFIICSGSIRESAAVEAMKLGADDYVMKDSLARLIPAIEREVGVAAGRQARKRTEESLRRSEALKSAMFEAAVDAIVIVDAQGKIVEFNPAAERMFGLERGGVLGKRMVDLIIPPALREQHQKAFEPYVATGQGALVGKPVEMTALRADGSEFPVEIAMIRIGLEGPALVTSYIRDITERKRLEEQSFQAQKMAAIAQLAAGVAHHFNNILAGVLGFSELMLKRLKPDDPLHEFAARIEKGAEQAASLTKQLLAFSRISPRAPRVVDLNVILFPLQPTVRSLIGDKIRLVTIHGKDLWQVKVDPVQVEQLLVSLASNAREAMPEGGTLTVETANVTLAEQDARLRGDSLPGSYVRLAVSDTGHGMIDEVKARAFEPFFTTKEFDQGTGMGLATCYAIVRQSGGNIRVDSEVGRGTTMEVYLPRCDAAESSPPILGKQTFRDRSELE